MVSALTTYFTQLASTTTGLTTTAAKMTENATGGSAATNGTNVATATANTWGELFTLGTTGAWPTRASEGSPSGNGFCDDSATLEGMTIVAGTWGASVRLATDIATSTVTADIHIRVYKRSSAGVYTLIGEMVSAAALIPSTTQTFNTFTGTTMSAVSFLTGDRLYTDAWLLITAEANSPTKVKITESSTALGLASGRIITPGYVVTGAPIGQSLIRMRMSGGRTIP